MSDKPGLPNEDRRKYKRAADVFIVTYRLQSPFEVNLTVGPREYAAVAMDIGEGGMGMDVSQAIPVGTPVRLKFKIVNEVAASERNRQHVFSLAGESRYCQLMGEKSHRVGVIFKDVSAEESVFIATYVKDQALRKYA